MCLEIDKCRFPTKPSFHAPKHCPSLILTVIHIRESKTIDVSGVLTVASLPERFFVDLQALQSISLSMTRIRVFPFELTNIPSLTYIDLSQNEIQTIPEEVTALAKLEYLDVSNNSISVIPTRIGFMGPTLKTLKLEGMSWYILRH